MDTGWNTSSIRFYAAPDNRAALFFLPRSNSFLERIATAAALRKATETALDFAPPSDADSLPAEFAQAFNWKTVFKVAKWKLLKWIQLSPFCPKRW